MENESNDTVNNLQENEALTENRRLTKKEKRALAKEQKIQERSKSKFKSRIRKLLIYLVVFFLIGFSGYKIWQWVNTPMQTVDNTGDMSAILGLREDDWIKGNPDAKVTLIEYADFECPACALYLDVIKQLGEEYGDDLRIVYRHFPLPQHSKAIDTAKAAEAAGFQGKFWEMNDLLYEKQDEWVEERDIKSKLFQYGKEMELDEERFISDYDSEVVSDSIESDEANALTLGVNATPTFFVNDKKVAIENNGYEDLRKAISEALGTSN